MCSTAWQSRVRTFFGSQQLIENVRCDAVSNVCDVLDLNWFISNDKLNFDTIHGMEMTNRQIPYFYGRKIWKLYRRAFDNDQRPSHTYARLTYIDPRSRPNADDMTHRRVTFSHFRTTAAIIRGAYELRVTNASDVVINDPRMHQPKFIQSRRIGYNNIDVSNESAASKIALLILLFHYKKNKQKMCCPLFLTVCWVISHTSSSSVWASPPQFDTATSIHLPIRPHTAIQKNGVYLFDVFNLINAFLMTVLLEFGMRSKI